MSSNTDYLDRLKGIREKYGCSQTKTSSYPNDTFLPPDRNTGSIYQKSDLYTLQKKKFAEPALPLSSSPLSKPVDYSIRPQSSLGLGNQTYTGGFSKHAERQRQIQQIRENYAASRKKVIDDFSAKNLTRDFSKDIPKNYSKDYLRGGERDYTKPSQRAYLNDYQKERRAGIKENETIGYTRSSIIDNVQQSVSPIKRMTMGEYDDARKSYRQREAEPSDTFWRQRQAKLSQMTANRLNQSNRAMLYKDDRILDHKLQPAKRSGIYGGDQLKTYGDSAGHVLSRMDLQNKPADYSVSNIDRIQQRIQSILNKR